MYTGRTLAGDVTKPQQEKTLTCSALAPAARGDGAEGA